MTIQAVIDQAFAAQKEAFLSGKTRDVDGRLANFWWYRPIGDGEISW